jgi:threonine dehydratase
VRGFGATIRFCAPNVAAREAACAEVQREHGATLIHPFDNAAVIAGQGTAALELLTDVAGLDAVVAPCGGGGLLSGTAIVARALAPAIRVFGAEPANAGDAAASFRSGRIEPLPPTTTIADGLRTTLAPRTFAAICGNVDAIGTCSEDAIVRAMRVTWERMKIVIEPSAAVPLACMLEAALDVRGLRIGVILSGGNVDLDRLPWQAKMTA